MKHVTRISARAKPKTDFWMNPAYRIPVGKFPLVDRFTQPGKRGQHPDHRNGGQFADHQPPRRATKSKAGKRHSQRHGLGRRLRHQHGAGLDRWRQDLGSANSARISAASRSGRGASTSRPRRARNTVMVNATNKLGQSQTSELIFNPAGYHNNVMQNITLNGVREGIMCNVRDRTCRRSDRVAGSRRREAGEAEKGARPRQGGGQLPGLP